MLTVGRDVVLFKTDLHVTDQQCLIMFTIFLFLYAKLEVRYCALRMPPWPRSVLNIWYPQVCQHIFEAPVPINMSLTAFVHVEEYDGTSAMKVEPHKCSVYARHRRRYKVSYTIMAAFSVCLAIPSILRLKS